MAQRGLRPHEARTYPQARSRVLGPATIAAVKHADPDIFLASLRALATTERCTNHGSSRVGELGESGLLLPRTQFGPVIRSVRSRGCVTTTRPLLQRVARGTQYAFRG